MTLPTTTPLNGTDDDSDMFGPPRSSPVGYHHQRSRVPMISPKLRQREERKRILQLCAHKLERIKDSEANLRRSVCINNTYSRLTDEVRREKQSRYLANLPKSETKPETAHDNIFSPYHSSHNSHNYNSTELRNDPFNHHHHQQQQQHQHQHRQHHHTNNNLSTTPLNTAKPTIPTAGNHNLITTNHHHNHHSTINTQKSLSYSTPEKSRSRTSSRNVDTDLEILDRELNAINASMPLIDPEITQGAEQLEKAVSSRKRSRSEDENDRLVREALSQFYLPTQRLISAIDECPLDIKRTKLSNNNNNSLTSLNNNINISSSGNSGDLDLDLGLDINQSQKEFEVIMDALRLGTSSPTPTANDSCGQAAMMSESGVFHNLVVTSLET